MLKGIIKSLVIAAMFTGTFFFVGSSQTSALFEGSTEQACQGAQLGANNGATNCDPGGEAESTINGVLRSVLSILSVVAGVISLIMIVIAGIKFITSQGDSSSTASARNTLIYAVVGIVIVLVSQAILTFVIGRATTRPDVGIPSICQNNTSPKCQ